MEVVGKSERLTLKEKWKKWEELWKQIGGFR